MRRFIALLAMVLTLQMTTESSWWWIPAVAAALWLGVEDSLRDGRRIGPAT